MQELFLETKASSGVSFNTINTIQSWWDYMEDGPFVKGVYWDTWYNGDNITNIDTQDNFIFYEDKLLGVPRIRQVRIANNTCTVHEDFADTIDTCFDEYRESGKAMNPYGDENNPSFRWQSEQDLKGSGHTGWLNSYDGSG